MAGLFLVTAREIIRDSVREEDYHEITRLTTNRQELSEMLESFHQENGPGWRCRFVVETL